MALNEKIQPGPMASELMRQANQEEWSRRFKGNQSAIIKKQKVEKAAQEKEEEANRLAATTATAAKTIRDNKIRKLQASESTENPISRNHVDRIAPMTNMDWVAYSAYINKLLKNDNADGTLYNFDKRFMTAHGIAFLQGYHRLVMSEHI